MKRDTPDLKLLRIFLTVARAQGFTSAQQELNLSTSAISNYMSQLERQLGIVLCHRGRSGFRLTSKGELFHAECLRLFAELDEFARYSVVLQGELRGTLTLGVVDCMVTDTTFPLPEVIATFSERNPGVHLHLQVHSPSNLQEGILDERIDVGIGSFFTRTTGLSFQTLYREQQWLYCSDRHPLFASKQIAGEMITSHRMVSRSYWNDAELARQGFRHPAGTVENMEAQLLMILSGQYIGYLPEHYAEHWVDRGKLRPIVPASYGYQAQFSMALRRGRSREPLAQAFREQVHAALTG